MDITLGFIANTAVYVVTIVVVLYSTFKDKIKEPFWKRLLAGLGAFFALAVFGTMLYVRIGVDWFGQSVMTLITSTCGFFIPYIVLDYSLGQCLFISAVVKCYADDIALLGTVVYYLARGETLESYVDFPVWPAILVAVVLLPIIMLFFKRLMRPALDCSGFLSSWSTIWIVPFLANAMYALYLQPVFTEVTSFPGVKFSFVPLLWIVMSFSSYITLLKALIEQSKNALLQEELHISDTQVTAQQKQLEHLQEHIKTTGKVRHDMRHLLLALQGFADKKDYKGIQKCLDDCLQDIERHAPMIYSHNTAVDSILGHYKYMAEDQQITVRITVSVGEELGVSDTDMCIILGNLLENAYEACIRQKEGKRYISVNISQSGRTLIIIVENSYEGTVRKEDGIFLSSKKKMRKGIGIISVTDVTKKYRGIPKFEYDGRRFKASLLLNGGSPGN